MMRRDTIILIFALAALVWVICIARPQIGMRLPGRPGVADNEKMLHDADDLIVGDSNVPGSDPVGRLSLAATRWGPLPCYAPLRQTTRGQPVRAQINNEETHG